MFARFADWLVDSNNFSFSIRIFRKAIYLGLLINILSLIPIATEVWGANAYMLEVSLKSDWFPYVFTLLAGQNYPELYWYVIGFQILSLLLGLAGRVPMLSSLAVYISTITLFRKATELSTGGHHLMTLLLFYNLFMQEKNTTALARTKLEMLKNMISNVAVGAARIQIALMYCTAGLLKMFDEIWLSGEGLYYVLSIDAFSHPWIQARLPTVGWLLVVGNYFALAYQLLFPALVWFHRLKYPLLMVGILFHASTAIVMGLVDFALFMIACYFIFVDDRVFRRLGFRSDRVG